MRLLFTSIRNIGHFQPLVPLIEACRALGHEVFVATPPDLAARVERTGATFLPFGHPGDEGLGPLWREVREVSAAERNRFVVGRIFAGACARAAIPALLEHVQRIGPDVIVREAQEYAGLIVGERLSVPTARVAISLEGQFHELRPALLSALEEHRAALGLASGGAASALESEPILTQFPSALWHEEESAPLFRFRVPAGAAPGPLPFASPSGWPTESAPLVYLTLGTVAGGMEELRAAYRLVLDAVAELPVRALLTTGEAIDPSSLGAIPPHVHVERFVPQADVFAHARAVLCHGGSGTVLGTLGAGLPMVVLPLFADQPENARHVERVGAGLSVPLEHATPKALRSALERVLGEPAFARRAQEVAAEIASLPQASAAPAWLERVTARA